MNTQSADLAARDTDAEVSPAAKPRLKAERPLVGESKHCTRCGIEQDLSEFAIKRGGRAAVCRCCQKKASDAHYLANKAKRLEQVAEQNRRTRAELTRVRDDYLEMHCVCERCSSTTELRLTPREGYEGRSCYEVISAAMAVKHMVEALENSRVLCFPCMSSEYGAINSKKRWEAAAGPSEA